MDPIINSDQTMKQEHKMNKISKKKEKPPVIIAIFPSSLFEEVV